MSIESVRTDALSDGRFEIDGERFIISDLFPAGGSDNHSIIKPRESIPRYLDILDNYERPRLVEIGIAYGGSTAFLALAADPIKMVAFEIAEARVTLLDAMLERKQLSSTVDLHYGVDQSDTDSLEAAVFSAFGEHALDLVVDDASHQLSPTLASFDTLFPRLRAGGTYVIEDWRCDHATAELLQIASENPESPYHDWAITLMRGDYGETPSGQRPLGSIPAELLGAPPWREGEGSPRPLSTMALYLLACQAGGSGYIEEICFTAEWITVVRGDAEPSPGWTLRSEAERMPLADSVLRE